MPAADANSAVNNVFVAKNSPRLTIKPATGGMNRNILASGSIISIAVPMNDKIPKVMVFFSLNKYVQIKIKRAQLKTTRLRFKCFLDNAQQNPERIINSDAPLCCHK